MGIDAQQLRRYVVKPTLEHLGLYSIEAEKLILGTAAVESQLKYLHQVGGPALGLWQMEQATHQDIWANFLKYKPKVGELVRGMLPANASISDDDLLIGNLNYACAMTRIHYYRVKEPMPNAVLGMAKYWKEHYNTHAGRGTPEKFVDAYNRLIAPIYL